MRFKLSTDAKKYVSSQEKDVKNRIYRHLREATQNPPKGDMITMSDGSGRCRLRVGDFRMLIRIKENIMYVGTVSPRGDAYKK